MAGAIGRGGFAGALGRGHMMRGLGHLEALTQSIGISCNAAKS
jgi:hypothetical protein